MNFSSLQAESQTQHSENTNNSVSYTSHLLFCLSIFHFEFVSQTIVHNLTFLSRKWIYQKSPSVRNSSRCSPEPINLVLAFLSTGLSRLIGFKRSLEARESFEVLLPPLPLSLHKYVKKNTRFEHQHSLTPNLH
jgi:hypothetical protein